MLSQFICSAVGFCFGLVTTYALNVAETTGKINLKADETPSVLAQAGIASRKSTTEPALAAEARQACPEPAALDTFRYQIAFEKTEESNSLEGLQMIHLNVWELGASTAFYVREPLLGFTPSVRIAYLFVAGEIAGGGTCPAETDWIKCVEEFSGEIGTRGTGRTCKTSLDLRKLPTWAPSPDSPMKQRVAAELRSEIEAKWKGVQEIVIRDFNVRDPHITIYLRTQDTEFFQGCTFHSQRQPHCDRWHSFGQVPLSSLRTRVFGEPYRLK